jgi:hypothetical protein
MQRTESPRSHKPFLGDLAGGDAAGGAVSILDNDLLSERYSAAVRAMTSLLRPAA